MYLEIPSPPKATDDPNGWSFRPVRITVTETEVVIQEGGGYSWTWKIGISRGQAEQLAKCLPALLAAVPANTPNQ